MPGMTTQTMTAKLSIQGRQQSVIMVTVSWLGRLDPFGRRSQ